jgi:hypothetical protein
MYAEEFRLSLNRVHRKHVDASRVFDKLGAVAVAELDLRRFGLLVLSQYIF